MSLFDSFARWSNVGASLAQAGASIYQAYEARKTAKKREAIQRERTRQEVTERRRQSRRLIGSIRATAGAQGIDLGDSSTSLLIDEEERFANEDIDNLLSFGDAQASIYASEGRAASWGGALSASGSLLGGVFSDWKHFG